MVARIGERKTERGRENSGRMRGLPRGGEESGGCGRRRVQIITIIIFPGNMAAERGWPRSLGRVGGKRGRGEAARQPGRVIIILQTTAAGMYLYNPSPSLSFTVPLSLSISLLSILFLLVYLTRYSSSRICCSTRPRGEDSRTYIHGLAKSLCARFARIVVSDNCRVIHPHTPFGCTSSFSTPHISRAASFSEYDPVENVHPRHDQALVSTPSGGSRSPEIFA